MGSSFSSDFLDIISRIQSQKKKKRQVRLNKNNKTKNKEKSVFSSTKVEISKQCPQVE